MYSQQQNITHETNFPNLTHTETKLNHARPNEVIKTDLVVSLIPIGFIIIWAVCFLLLSKLRTLTLDKILVTTNPLNKVPCKNCQFFSNNRYLKCAVQPEIVLTEQAKDCSDYCPKNGKSTSQN